MNRADVVTKAVQILAEVGLPDLTMRRLGTELGVQQSALYHHFANKQALLGAVADEIVATRPALPAPDPEVWEDQVRQCCTDLRAALLSYPDGADVVSSMFAFGLGGAAPFEDLATRLRTGGLDPATAEVAARTLLHYVHGHAVAQQARETAARLGAIEQDQRPDDFGTGLDLVLVGIAGALAPVRS